MSLPTSSHNNKDYFFIVKGVSGNEVMLDKTWYQACIPLGNGIWMKSMRTLSGNELSTTILEYENGSLTPDCENGCSMITIFVQTLTYDNVQVPIQWIDSLGNPTQPPAGLEHVTEGNGASGRVSFATRTPLTQAAAQRLNQAKAFGFTDWEMGKTKNIQFPPGKGTIIVDDRTDIGAVYDGLSINPSEYPTLMPNIPPHTGPLTRTVKF